MGLIIPGLGLARLARLSHSLAAMAKAGIPAARCFELLGAEAGHKKVREVTSRVAEDIRAGSTLGESLRAQGSAFPLLFTGLVTIGERTGTLERSCALLAEHYDHMLEARRLLVKQITYPIALLVLLTGLVLPMALILGATAIILRLPWARRCVLRCVLALWPFSRLYRDLAQCRAAWAMDLLLRTNLAPHHQLIATAQILEPPSLARPFHEAAARVKDGTPMARALGAVKWLTPQARVQIEVGEASGKLHETFAQIARQSSERARHTMVCLLYPLGTLLIVFMGLIVLLSLV